MDGIGWKLVGMVHMTIEINEQIARHIHHLEGQLMHLSEYLYALIQLALQVLREFWHFVNEVGANLY